MSETRTCPQCGEEFINDRDWALHMAGHLRQPETPEAPVDVDTPIGKARICKRCGIETRDVFEYEKHMVDEHGAPDFYMVLNLHADIDDEGPWWCDDRMDLSTMSVEDPVEPAEQRMVDVDDVDGPVFNAMSNCTVPLWVKHASDQRTQASLAMAEAMVDRTKDAMCAYIDKMIDRLRRMQKQVKASSPVFRRTGPNGTLEMDLAASDQNKEDTDE